jgi:hypothetical protein
VDTVPGAEARGVAASRDEDTRQKFRGWVDDIAYFYPQGARPPSNDPAIGRIPDCTTDSRILSEAEIQATPYRIDIPPYLPPGAIENEAPYGIECQSDLISAFRRFDFRPYGGAVSIFRHVGRWTIEWGVSAGRISSGTIEGRKAAFIKPLTPEGFGDSAILVREAWGVTQISGDDLPFDELTRIAEGVVGE